MVRAGRAGRAGILWILLLVVGAGVAVFFHRSASPRVRPSERVSPTPVKKTAQEPLAAKPERKRPSDEEEDRKLREEQLSAALEMARDFPDSDNAMYLAGLVHNEQGDSSRAVEYWERAAALDSRRADVYNSLGYAALLKEENEKAAKYFRKAIRCDPSLTEARVRLAQALLSDGGIEEAAGVLEKIERKSAQAHRLLGQAYQHLRKFERAKREYLAALKLNPGFAEALYGLAVTCARLGERDEAVRYRKLFNELKSEYQKIGRRKRSIWNPLAITRVSVAHTHTDVGRVYFSQGKPGRAVELWKRAADLDPSNTRCRALLAGLYLRQGHVAEALSLYEELTRIKPREALFFLYCGNLYARRKRFKEAEGAFKKVTELEPGRPEGYFALAKLYLETGGDRGAALRAIKTAVRLDPENAVYKRILAGLEGGR